MASNEEIFKKYVCSDVKLYDIYVDFSTTANIAEAYKGKKIHVYCEPYLSRFPGKSSFYKNLFYYQPVDDFAIHAVIRYLRDNKLTEQIGIENDKNLEWSLNWPRYESILKELYFKILTEEPRKYLYIHLVIKPLKFVVELAKAAFYFFNSFLTNFIFIFSIFIISLFLQLFCMRNIEFKKDLIEIENSNYKYLIEIIFIIMIIFIGSFSIVFYPAPQAGISDFIIIAMVLTFFYFKKKFIDI